MTRSRFIKLLMAHGECRNESINIALYYNIRNYSYKNAYSDYLIKHNLKNAFSRLGQSLVKASGDIAKLSDAFSKLKSAVKVENNLKNIF